MEGRGLELIENEPAPERPPNTYETFFTGTIKECPPKHDTCVITQELVDPGDLYHQCSEYHQSVSVEGMREWWNTCRNANKSVTCPACRKEWTDSSLYLYSFP